MAIELINIGQIANDGTGDDLREAFIKVNANFEDLDLRDNEKTTVTNLGSGERIFDNIVNYDIKLKSISAGDGIGIEATPTGEIQISNITESFNEIIVESNNRQEMTLSTTDRFKLYAGVGLSTSIDPVAKIMRIDNTKTTRVIQDTDPTLGGDLDADAHNILSANNIQANTFTGNLIGNVTGLINGYDPSTIAPYFDNYFDFGEMGRTVNGIIDWLIEDADVDFGTFPLPDPRTIDLGAIAD